MKFELFRGKDLTPEVIGEFLKDWKDIDLTFLLDDRAKVAQHPGEASAY
jgi:hypothetical protein